MNLGAIGSAFRSLADALINRRPREASMIFLYGLKRDVRSAFEREADPVTGEQWKPLKYRVGRILVLTGRMRAAAIAAADAAKPSGMGVKVELTDPPYAAAHQMGTRRIPRRRFFGVSAETVVKARKAWADDMVQLSVGKAKNATGE